MTFIHVIVIADDDDDGGSETLMTTSSRGNVRNDLSEWQQRHATLVLSKIKVLFLFTIFFYFFIFTLGITIINYGSCVVCQGILYNLHFQAAMLNYFWNVLSSLVLCNLLHIIFILQLMICI